MTNYTLFRSQLFRLEALIKNSGLPNNTSKSAELNPRTLHLQDNHCIYPNKTFPAQVITWSLNCHYNIAFLVDFSAAGGHKMPPTPQIVLYYATKHGVTVVTEGIRKELVEKRSNIRVSVSVTSTLHPHSYKHTNLFLLELGGFQWSALAWGDLQSSCACVHFPRLSIASFDGEALQHMSYRVCAIIIPASRLQTYIRGQGEKL